MGKRTPSVERFWPKVDLAGPVPERAPHLGPCWLWAGAHSDTGYGSFRADGRNVGSHRFAYELLVGPVPMGLHIDHLCRVRSCCNPAHLEAVTKAENDRRGMSPFGINAQKTHCIRGHEFTLANTYVRPDGDGHQCRTCKREDSRRRAAQRRAAAYLAGET